MTRLGIILKGIGSALALLLLVAAVPAVLIHIGAFPSTMPDLTAMWLAATRPDTGNRAVFAVLAVLVWAAWANFTFSVAREVVAAVRTRGRLPAAPIRGLGWSARPAEILVAAVIAVFITAPVLGAAATPAGAHAGTVDASAGAPIVAAAHHLSTPAAPTMLASHIASTPAPTAYLGQATRPADAKRTGKATTTDAKAATTKPAADLGRGTTRYTVKRRDTLWSIADRHLGDPLRYREIASLNPTIGRDYEIHAGQVLTLPADAASGPARTQSRKPADTRTPATRQTSGPTDSANALRPDSSPGIQHVTVKAGDTLSEIAAEHGLHQWGPVWAANKGKAQPGGKRFTNPDHIEVGWDITLPAKATKRAAPAPPAASAPVPVPGAATSSLGAAPSAPMAPSQRTAGPGILGKNADTGRGGIDHDGEATVAPTQPAPTQPAAPSTLSGPTAPPSPSTATPGPATPTATQPRSDAGGDNDAAPSAAEDDVYALPSAVPLAAGGALAALGVLSALVLQRRQQFRHRRPGRTIATGNRELAPVERAAITVGGPAADDIARLDEVLRRVAATDVDVLEVIAVQLNGKAITLHLGRPATLAEPWLPVDGGHGARERHVWRFPASATAEEAGPPPNPDGIAPCPALVHVGSDATSSWLLNLEQIGGLVVTGADDRCQDLGRVIAGQLGLNPWGDYIGVNLVGFGAELVNAAPERLRHTSARDAAEAIEVARREAARRANQMSFGLNMVQARRQTSFDEIWPSHVVLIAGPLLADTGRHTSGDTGSETETDPALHHQPGLADAVSDLLQLIHLNAGLTGESVVVVAGEDLSAPVDQVGEDAHARVHLEADGTMTLSNVAGLDLTLNAVGWDEDTARGVSMLLEHARMASDTEIPDATGDQPWQALSDATGALRNELVMPRATPNVHDVDAGAACALPLADEVYLETSATTTEDLATLAPLVPHHMREEVEGADPTLDEDVAAWFDETNPVAKLSVLGPVTLRTSHPDKGRRPYYAELAAYLAFREHGASTDQIATAFSLAPGSARKYISTLRDLLGSHPVTGLPYLPNANESKSAKARGVNIYQLNGVLVDADLFRRLRLRGEARGEQGGGIDDYVTALRLVTGEPFSQMRDQGGAWIVDGDRIDHHATSAILDVAHLVNVYALAAGDTASARAAADIARMAMPADEIYRLDLAATDAAEGRTDDLRDTLVRDVYNRSDDGYPPLELSARTKQVLARHRDWLSQAS